MICSDNALTALDLSSNSKLTNLNASGNIREITLTGNTFDLSRPARLLMRAACPA